MRLRIKSDGTAIGTRLETETGELIHGVTGIEWKVAIGSEPAHAVVHLHALVPLDAIIEREQIRVERLEASA